MKRKLAMLLVCALALSLFAGCSGNGESTSKVAAPAKTLAAAVYPEMAPYPDMMSFYDEKTGEFDDEGLGEAYSAWEETLYSGEELEESAVEAVRQFTLASLPVFLGDAGEGNRVYSPLNIYMALEMQAEITDGETRQQILDILGVDSLDSLRSQAKILWESTYCDDGRVTTILGSSVWLNQNVLFNQNTLNTLAETYYASSYQGEMGSDALNSALQDWLNDQTQGFLEEQAGGVELDWNTVIALATTIYYRAKWADEFWEGNNDQKVFHGTAGDVTCDFMNQSCTMNYFWGDHYSAIRRNLGEGDQMWLILPDEGVEVTDLLTDQQVTKLLTGSEEIWNEDSCQYLVVNQSIPKFDVNSDLNLGEGLQVLGITDAFQPDTADFTPLTEKAADAEGIYVSKIEHAARVAIDEEGIIAAAYTVMVVEAAEAPPEEEVDFVLDRPFLFVVQSKNDLTLFAGIVNNV